MAGQNQGAGEGVSVTPHPKYPGLWIIRWYPEGRKKDPKTGKPSNKRERAIFEGSYAEALAHYADLLKTAKVPTIFRKLRVYLRKRYTRGLLFVNPATGKE